MICPTLCSVSRSLSGFSYRFVSSKVSLSSLGGSHSPSLLAPSCSRPEVPYIRVLREEKPLLILFFIFETGSPTQPGAPGFGQAGWPLLVLGLQTCVTMLRFCLREVDANLGAHVCASGTFPTDPSPQPLLSYIFKHFCPPNRIFQVFQLY